ncbi:hypothetical protein MKW92_013403, partial [Papaver armeniacum]
MTVFIRYGYFASAFKTPALAPIIGQWEKPEELTLFEQRKQQKLSHPQKPLVQQFQYQAQSQSQTQ